MELLLLYSLKQILCHGLVCSQDCHCFLSITQFDHSCLADIGDNAYNKYNKQPE